MGTEEGILELNGSHISTITSYARVCYRKLKKPALLQPDDLVNEGILIFLKAAKEFDPLRNDSFDYFLKQCLRNGFGRLVRKSYRKITQVSVDPLNPSHENVITKFLPERLVVLFELSKQLNYIETEYLIKLLNPSQLTNELIGTKRKSVGKLVRKDVGITNRQGLRIERKIRRIIGQPGGELWMESTTPS